MTNLKTNERCRSNRWRLRGLSSISFVFVLLVTLHSEAQEALPVPQPDPAPQQILPVPPRVPAPPMQSVLPAPSVEVQPPSSSSSLKKTLSDPCGCQNTPGGYPCLGGCQPCMHGVDCAYGCGEELRWSNIRRMNFGAYGPGGYAGPARLAHLSEYRLRPGDQLSVIYLITRRQSQGVYKLMPGDEVFIESIADPDLTRGTLDRGIAIQPDGTITVRLLGQVHAAGLSVAQLRDVLEDQYNKYYPDPSIDVTPIKTNTLADDIRNAVGGQSGFNQQALEVTVQPDGKIRLPGIGEVCVQGFSLNDLKKEINLRYDEIVVGIETEPILNQQAAHFVHVLGRVATPSRIQMEAPTTVLSAIAAAGGHLPTGNMRQVVVFRRAEDWRLISTVLDLQGAVYGKRPTPADEIWLRDGDVVIVPDRPITRFNDWAEQIFTNGLYRIFPIQIDSADI